MGLIPVEERKDLARDSKSKAILSIDTQKLKDYKEKRALFSKLVNSSREIEQLKKDVSDLKEKVNMLLNINNYVPKDN